MRPTGLLRFLATLALACGPAPATTGASEGDASSADGTAPDASATSGSGGSVGPTSSSTSDATTTGDPDTGCEFVCMTDMPWCLVDCLPCDPWTQDCPRGEKCSAEDRDGDGVWDAQRCYRIIGDGQHGDPCTVLSYPASGEDTCAPGHMCWYIDADTLEGTCVARCTGNPENPNCAPPDTTCWVAHSGVIVLCLPTCDPVLADCPPGEACVPVLPEQPGFACAPDPSGDAAPAGTPCKPPGACNAGLFCADTASFPDPACEGSPGCCAPYCHLDTPDCPPEPPGLMCMPWYEQGAAPEGYEHVGACQVPE